MPGMNGRGPDSEGPRTGGGYGRCGAGGGRNFDGRQERGPQRCVGHGAGRRGRGCGWGMGGRGMAAHGLGARPLGAHGIAPAVAAPDVHENSSGAMGPDKTT